MINDIRNIVDFILNKESRGYVTPIQFNAYAKQAQQEILDEYINDYNKATIKRNNRLLSQEYGDDVKKLRDKIDVFVTDPTTLAFSTDHFTTPANLIKSIALLYNNKEIEEVAKNKIYGLLDSNLTAPSVFYPIYTKSENKIYVYPSTIQSNVKLVYLRAPKDPNWTYQMIGDNPIFNPSDSGYQDFEISNSDKYILMMKILKYAGSNMREDAVTQAAAAFEAKENQEN